MKTLATLATLLFVASAAPAAVIHDESVDGDLGTDPLAPTALAFTVGGNTILGTVNGTPPADRDYITFTVPAGHAVTGLNLLAYAPDNLGFVAFNAGNTSFIPSGATDAFFLAGIHIGAAEVGLDLMPLFVSSAVTTNSLPSPELGPGTYCFLIQQTSQVLQSYSLEFVLEASVGTDADTWSGVKSTFR